MKLIKPQKDTKDSQGIFIDSVNAIGDLLVHEATKLSRTDSVITGLQRLNQLTLDFFKLAEEDEEKFEEILLSNAIKKIAKKNKKEAGARVWFQPRKHGSSQINGVTICLGT